MVISQPLFRLIIQTNGNVWRYNHLFIVSTLHVSLDGAGLYIFLADTAFHIESSLRVWKAVVVRHFPYNDYSLGSIDTRARRPSSPTSSRDGAPLHLL
jgi:hypothetical protein